MDVHAAALSGDVEGVCRYIADSGDPNILNEAGITPLHRSYACNFGSDLVGGCTDSSARLAKTLHI